MFCHLLIEQQHWHLFHIIYYYCSLNPQEKYKAAKQSREALEKLFFVNIPAWIVTFSWFKAQAKAVLRLLNFKNN